MAPSLIAGLFEAIVTKMLEFSKSAGACWPLAIRIVFKRLAATNR